jgi:hypothetical protein
MPSSPPPQPPLLFLQRENQVKLIVTYCLFGVFLTKEKYAGISGYYCSSGQFYFYIIIIIIILLTIRVIKINFEIYE